MTSFSIVVPTRDRPELLRAVLASIQLQTRPPDEVVVSDNSSLMWRETEQVVRDSGPITISYIRPERELSAVDHWNFAIQKASGDYVAALTDKMPLISRTLSRASEVVSQEAVDIVNWPSLPFVPAHSNHPTGLGEIFSPLTSAPAGREGLPYTLFEPREVLREKAIGYLPRRLQSPSFYGRGKICFGMYSRKLLRRMLSLSGRVCVGATHDYSCMVQGLALADGLAEMRHPGICHISLPVGMSTGSAIETSPQSARDYWKSVGDSSTDPSTAYSLVPGLYASSHNLVSSDFRRFHEEFGLPSEINLRNWLRNIALDVTSPFIAWESEAQRSQQLDLVVSLSHELGFASDVEDILSDRSLPPASRRTRTRMLLALERRSWMVRRISARRSGTLLLRGQLASLLTDLRL